jgi:hypothetical protein
MSDAESQPGISRREYGEQMEALGKACRCTRLAVIATAILRRVPGYVTALAMLLHTVAIAVHSGRHARGCFMIVLSMFMTRVSPGVGCSPHPR